MNDFLVLMEASKNMLVVVDFTATWYESISDEGNLADMTTATTIRPVHPPCFTLLSLISHILILYFCLSAYISLSNPLFLSTKRCGPCRFIAPVFEKLAAENPDAIFVKVDVDEADDVAGSVGIQAMPTFQFYKNGTKIDELCGADQAALARKVAQHK